MPLDTGVLAPNSTGCGRGLVGGRDGAGLYEFHILAVATRIAFTSLNAQSLSPADLTAISFA